MCCQAAITAAARYGGDTDTLAAMTGALASALHGPAYMSISSALQCCASDRLPVQSTGCAEPNCKRAPAQACTVVKVQCIRRRNRACGSAVQHFSSPLHQDASSKSANWLSKNGHC